ncbi:MAG: hypothetical protein KDE04_02460 [Anaerolineales bacterium]|nr:hypothetical protein [Anaerolineales bacterium]
MVEVDWPAGTLAVMTITYTGGRNFVVKTLEASGDTIDLAVNVIGAYTGTRPFNFEGDPAYLEIESSGSWEVTIIPFITIEPVVLYPYNGSGDDVLLLASHLRSGRTTITHQGSRNFVVKAVDTSGRFDLVVNEIGNYSGTVLFRDYFILEIRADGAWSIDAAE